MLRDLIGKMSASAGKLRARLAAPSSHGRKERSGEADDFFVVEDGEASAPVPSADGPRRRLAALRSALAQISGNKIVILAAGALAFLILALAARCVLLSLPLERGSAPAEIRNRDLFLSLEVPPPPLPYDAVVIRRDPAGFPTAGEMRALAFRPSPEAVEAAARKASEAVDALFAGVP